MRLSKMGRRISKILRKRYRVNVEDVINELKQYVVIKIKSGDYLLTVQNESLKLFFSKMETYLH